MKANWNAFFIFPKHRGIREHPVGLGKKLASANESSPSQSPENFLSARESVQL